MTCAIIIRGPAGVGKTTIGEILNKKLNALFINYDKELKKRKLNYVQGEKCVPESNFFTVNKKVMNEINNALNNNFYVIIEQNFYHKTCLIDLAEKIKGEVFVFTLNADVGECIKRDKTRKGIGEEAIKAVHKLSTSFKHGIEINTKRKNAKQIAEEIISYLNLN